MNREFLLEAVLGITVGSLIAVFAVYRTSKPPSPGVLRRAGMVGVLVYALIAAQILVQQGMTWLGVLFLLVLLIAAVLASLKGRSGSTTGPAADWTRRLVALGLTAAMLIAAGQTLSMVGLVDPRVVVLLIAVVAGLFVAREALAGSSRVGSLAMWLMVVPVIISLVLGLLLGDTGEAVNPIIEVTGLQWATALGLLVCFIALGWSDPGMQASRKGTTGVPTRMLVGASLVVLLICAGLLMFFGGAILAPSMQFFVVPANIDAMPGLAGVLIAVLTVLFIALTASTLSGVGGQQGTVKWLALVVGAAALVALIDPGLDRVVIATSLVAAVLVGSRGERGTQVGLAAALVAIVVLAVTGRLSFDWPAALAVVVVAAIAAVVPASDKDAATAEEVLSP